MKRVTLGLGGSSMLALHAMEAMAAEDRAEAEANMVHYVQVSENTLERVDPPAETTVEIEEPAANPLDGLPASSTDWRLNNRALAPIAAQSPLETRQQRRAASKALSRGLATAGKLKEREARVLDKRRARADAAHARYQRIAGHVPTTTQD